LPNHRIALEIHLRNETLCEGVAEDREMNVGWPPIVDAVRPWIGAGLDGAKPVAPFLVRDHASAAAEIGIEGSQIGLLPVAIAPACIGLPELHQSVVHGTGVFVQHAAIDDDALADRVSGFGVVADQIVIERAELIVAEHRPRHLRDRVVEREQRILRGAQDRGLVLRRESGRVPVPVPLIE
jgi:hypothetical protein